MGESMRMILQFTQKNNAKNTFTSLVDMGEAVLGHPLYGSELGSERSNCGLLT